MRTKTKAEKDRALAAIRRARGSLKPKLDGTSFAQRRAEYKAEEIALEEAKYQRCVASFRIVGKNCSL